MKTIEKNRNFDLPLQWIIDLNHDCKAKWSGLILHTTLMETNYWWWFVYDVFNHENQIDSSNKHNNLIIEGEKAREEAEEIAKIYLKNELIQQLKSSEKEIDFNAFKSDLKLIGISPMETIVSLIKNFNFKHKDARNKVFEAPVCKGLKEQS